jgi:hypothetical protein
MVTKKSFQDAVLYSQLNVVPQDAVNKHLAGMVHHGHGHQQAFAGCTIERLMVAAGKQLQGSAGKHS